MRAVPILFILGLLAACGADGAPVPPGDDARSAGVTIAGDARIGVIGGI